MRHNASKPCGREATSGYRLIGQLSQKALQSAITEGLVFRRGGSGVAQQVMGVEQLVSDLRVFLQPPPNGRRNRLASLAAKTGLLGDRDANPAHAAHLVGTGCDVQANAQLLIQALLQALEIRKARQILQALQQTMLFVPGQTKDAQVAVGGFLQPFTATDAGRWGAGLTDWNRSSHGA